MMNEIVRQAEMKLVEAQKGLVEAVKDAYPTDKIVTVKVGRSTFDFQVTGYCSWWSEPGRLKGFNTRTGKTREIHHGQIIGASHDQ